MHLPPQPPSRIPPLRAEQAAKFEELAARAVAHGHFLRRTDRGTYLLTLWTRVRECDTLDEVEVRLADAVHADANR